MELSFWLYPLTLLTVTDTASISASKEQESEILLYEINALLFSSVKTSVCLDVERNKRYRCALLLTRWKVMVSAAAGEICEVKQKKKPLSNKVFTD